MSVSEKDKTAAKLINARSKLKLCANHEKHLKQTYDQLQSTLYHIQKQLAEVRETVRYHTHITKQCEIDLNELMFDTHIKTCTRALSQVGVTVLEHNMYNLKLESWGVGCCTVDIQYEHCLIKCDKKLASDLIKKLEFPAMIFQFVRDNWVVVENNSNPEEKHRVRNRHSLSDKNIFEIAVCDQDPVYMYGSSLKKIKNLKLVNSVVLIIDMDNTGNSVPKSEMMNNLIKGVQSTS